MAILVGPDTKVICQGFTGRTATFHCGSMLAYGTNIVGGVVPGKGGRQHLDRPVFENVSSAMEATGANASLVFVPPTNAANAIIEAIDTRIELIVCVTERIPVLDMIRVRKALAGSSSVLIGPNSQGLLVPGVTQLGVMSTVDAKPGVIGIASRSASLTSEIVLQTTAAGLGQSTTVGVGGDPIHGIGLKRCVELFLDDHETKGIVLVGEIGGMEEQETAKLIAERKPSKPIVALIVGRHAPPKRRMGHAGALAEIGSEATAESKIKALTSAGVIVATDASQVGETIRNALMVSNSA